jgi:hypothetical protein
MLNRTKLYNKNTAPPRRLLDVSHSAGIISASEVKRTIENNEQNCSDSICRSLAHTADWRKNLQTRFPPDPRNGRAAQNSGNLRVKRKDSRTNNGLN